MNGGGGSLAILCNAFHFFFAGTIHISPKKYITGNVINSGLLIKSEERHSVLSVRKIFRKSDFTAIVKDQG